jgi:hypothetical protein
MHNGLVFYFGTKNFITISSLLASNVYVFLYIFSFNVWMYSIHSY